MAKKKKSEEEPALPCVMKPIRAEKTGLVAAPNGSWAAEGQASGIVRAIDDTGAPTWERRVHAKGVWALHAVHGSAYLAAFVGDRTHSYMRLDPKTGAELDRKPYTQIITKVAMHDDQLALGVLAPNSDQGEVHVIDHRTDKVLSVCSGFTWHIHGLRFSSTGRWLLVSGEHPAGTFTLWDALEGKLVAGIPSTRTSDDFPSVGFPSSDEWCTVAWVGKRETTKRYRLDGVLVDERLGTILAVHPTNGMAVCLRNEQAMYLSLADQREVAIPHGALSVNEAYFWGEDVLLQLGEFGGVYRFSTAGVL